MATVMELSSPAEEFPLGAVFENVLGVTVELERLIPREALIIPWLWVRDASVEDIEAAFDVHAGVVNVKLIDRLEDEYLLRAGGAIRVLRCPERARRGFSPRRIVVRSAGYASYRTETAPRDRGQLRPRRTAPYPGTDRKGWLGHVRR